MHRVFSVIENVDTFVELNLETVVAQEAMLVRSFLQSCQSFRSFAIAVHETNHKWYSVDMVRYVLPICNYCVIRRYVT